LAVEEDALALFTVSMALLPIFLLQIAAPAVARQWQAHGFLHAAEQFQRVGRELFLREKMWWMHYKLPLRLTLKASSISGISFARPSICANMQAANSASLFLFNIPSNSSRDSGKSYHKDRQELLLS